MKKWRQRIGTDARSNYFCGMKRMILQIWACLLGAFSVTSCFTGIENTGLISAKDVAKVKANSLSAEEQFWRGVALDSFSCWQKGKRFYVTDNSVRRIFAPSREYDVSSLELKGTVLRLTAIEDNRQIDNTRETVLVFSDGKQEYRYFTGKTMAEMKTANPAYLVPFMTDMDMVERVDSLLAGNTYYLKSNDWQTRSGEAVSGIRYVPVEVDSVVPGDAVYPFYVEFDCEGQKAGIFMSSSTSSVRSKTFDRIFSFTDIRKTYKNITDENWERIVHGRIALGMTKDECSLSLGSPRSIARIPTRGGLFERWNYDNGVFAVFDNGLLVDFRQ